jgi:hypothetical protein
MEQTNIREWYGKELHLLQRRVTTSHLSEKFSEIILGPAVRGND